MATIRQIKETQMSPYSPIEADVLYGDDTCSHYRIQNNIYCYFTDGFSDEKTKTVIIFDIEDPLKADLCTEDLARIQSIIDHHIGVEDANRNV